MNITFHCDRGSIPEDLQDVIRATFLKRISSIACNEFEASIIINPNLAKYSCVESLNGYSDRYLSDIDRIVDDEVRIRLATLRVDDYECSILYLFSKIYHPAFIPSEPMNNSNEAFLQDYLNEEISFLITVISNQKSLEKKVFNTFCVSGDIGSGKTFFIKLLAEKTQSRIWTISYTDIDGENTESISKNIKKVFNRIKNNDFILIEDADSFLAGNNINRFVKNALISALGNRKDAFIFFESMEPANFDNDLKKLISKHTYIKPLTQSVRSQYLSYFLKKNDISVDLSTINKLYCPGFTLRDLESTVFFTKILIDSGQNIETALAQACDKVSESKTNESLSLDSPFRAVKPRYELNDLILPESKKDRIKYAASLIQNIPLVYNDWNFKKIDPYPRAIINFHGRPGTGKTMCAHAIAKYLGKDLLALNYAEIESRYIGDAPKKLESAFAYARKHDTVMFFDEADSFLGKRIEDVSHSADQALNSLRSTMLIQLEMFEGVVIFASNLRENYDKAFESRFLYEISFELPDIECRKVIIQNYFKLLPPLLNANYSDEAINLLAEMTEGLSGREIKNVVLESLNKFAYTNTHKEEADASFQTLPLEYIKECIEIKKQDIESEVTVNSDVDQDKKIIGKKLAEKYGSADTENPQYVTLLTTAYYAAWSDDVLDDNELLFIQKTENELCIKTTSSYTIRENLPALSELAEAIANNNLEREAIELCCRVVAADGLLAPSERNFIADFCHCFGVKEGSINQILSYAETIAKENLIINSIDLSK